MKKIFLPSNEIKNPWGLRVWLLFHLSIPFLLAVSFFLHGPVHVNTSFMDMLPQAGRTRAATKADSIMGERNGREAVIFAASPDFEKAKKGAALLYEEFKDSPMQENISLYLDSSAEGSAIAQFAEYIYDYRFVIAEKETRHLLETGRAEEIAYDALAAAYNAFGVFPLDNIDKDPFLLAERRIKTFLSSALLGGGNLDLKDDVLSAYMDETWYVMLRMTLTPQAVSLKKDKNAVKEIYAAVMMIKEAVPELDFYFSGVPFHSYESSSGAQKEISIISTITLILILILFLFVFRSPLPVFCSIMAALVSLGAAAGSVFIIFREIHIITFVFGTTLIGICVDYSIHFFVHWKGNSALKSGYEIRSSISKSIIMSFISTQVCFIAFLFAPFPILKQFAVFSMAGLISSFFTSYFFYPLLAVPAGEERIFKIFTGKFFLRLKNFTLPAFAGNIFIAILAALAVFIVAFRQPKIENDIRSFYTISDNMLESEKRAACILDHGSSPWYFIVSGETPEQTLENEEKLTLRLEEEVTKGNLRSFLGTSVFVPSVKSQRETYEAMKALLPLASTQYEYLGFPPEYTEIFYREFAAGEKYCFPEDAPSQAGVSNLWIGKADDQYYSCVIPLQPGDEAVFRSIAGEFESVFFINKVKDIGSDLDTLTKTIMKVFLASYFVIFILVFFIYHWRDSIIICAIPVFLVLITITALTISKFRLDFFSIAALVLIFGLGLDYIFYITGGKHKGERILSSFAVTLSFLTTILSFSALGFSSFVPVQIFGFTISIGLSAAFISANFLHGKQGSENHRMEG